MHETGEELSVTRVEVMVARGNELQVTEGLKADFNEELDVAAFVT